MYYNISFSSRVSPSGLTFSSRSRRKNRRQRFINCRSLILIDERNKKKSRKEEIFSTSPALGFDDGTEMSRARITDDTRLVDFRRPAYFVPATIDQFSDPVLVDNAVCLTFVNYFLAPKPLIGHACGERLVRLGTAKIQLPQLVGVDQ